MIIERNTDIAAALSTLHCVVHPEKATEVDGGAKRVHFLLGPTFQLPNSPAKHSVSGFRESLRKNAVPASHPVMRQLLTAENRRAFLDFLAKPHIGLRLVPHEGAHKITHEKGMGLPGKQSVQGSGAAIFKTRSIRSAIALMTAGYALLWIEGPDDRREFYLDNNGPEGSAIELARLWRTEPKMLSADSVFLLAIAFLTNRDVLMQYVEKYIGRLILRKPHTSRQITIPENASGRTWDKARKFLLG